MTRATPDPTRWLTDLLKGGHLEWQAADVTAVAKAMTARQTVDQGQADLTAPAVGTFFAHQRVGSRCPRHIRPIADRRFADEAWTKIRRGGSAHLRPADQLRKALDAAPLDDDKAQWGFALGRVMDAPSRRYAGHQPGGISWRWIPAARACEGMRLYRAWRGAASRTTRSAFEVGRNVATTRHGRAAERAHAADPVRRPRRGSTSRW
jgi:hypothetical protein